MGIHLVLGQDDAVGWWVHQQFGCDWRPDPGKAFGFVNDDGELVAGWTFQEYNGKTMFINVSAVKGCGWYSPQRAWEVYDYTFNVCKCNALRCRVLSWNTSSLGIINKFGFELEATLTDFDNKGGDMLIYKLTKEKADVLFKDLQEKYGVK